MAIREYIGARYVPRFTGTYDPTQIYEALDVVDNGSGTSYIARKTVPAGTPLTDNTYWFIYGASSGAIINLQNQIDTIVNTDIPAIQSDISGLDADIDAIKADKRRIVCVTDSYGTHSVTNWAARTFTNLGIAAGDHFLFAEGSSGFSHQGQNGHTFETLLSSNIGSVTDPDSITDVIFGGGTNDFYYYVDRATLVAAITGAIAYAKSQFTNARIWVAFMGYWSRMLPAMRADYYDTLALYASQAITDGARFINAYAPMHSYYNRSDNMHPNEYGNQAIAEIVSSVLRGTSVPMPLTCSAYGGNQFNANITVRSDADSTGGTPQLNMLIKGDDALIHFTKFSLVKAAFWTWTAGTNFEIGTYPTDNIPVISANDFVHSIPIAVRSGGNVTIEFARVSFIDSGTPGVATIVVNPARSIANIDFIQIQDNTMVVPLVSA